MKITGNGRQSWYLEDTIWYDVIRVRILCLGSSMPILKIWFNMRYQVQMMVMFTSEITSELHRFHSYMVPQCLPSPKWLLV